MKKCPNCSQEVDAGSIICQYCQTWDVCEIAPETAIRAWPNIRSKATLFYLVEKADNDQQIISELFSHIPEQYHINYGIFKKDCIEYMHVDPEKYGMPSLKFTYPELKFFCFVKSGDFFDLLALEIINKGIKNGEYKKSFFSSFLKMPESLYEHFKKMLKVNYYKQIREELKLSLESLNVFLIQKNKELIGSAADVEAILADWEKKIKEKNIHL